MASRMKKVHLKTTLKLQLCCSITVTDIYFICTKFNDVLHDIWEARNENYRYMYRSIPTITDSYVQLENPDSASSK